jgi:hypothetical protein
MQGLRNIVGFAAAGFAFATITPNAIAQETTFTFTFRILASAVPSSSEIEKAMPSRLAIIAVGRIPVP